MMGWKELSYWKKFGIIFFFLGTVVMLNVFALYGSCTKFVDSESCGPLKAMIYPSNIIFSVIVAGIPSFIGGSILGFIYGKIKKTRGAEKSKISGTFKNKIFER